MAAPGCAEVIALAEAGYIAARIERVAFADALHAYELLAEGAVIGRAVVVPNG